ncbi:MAG: metal ABC transporter ATP-binding protein [Deltaproteobacteria bacterium]
MPLALQVEQLRVRFGKSDVIERLSFGVERGTTLGIIGPNGAGKTALFRALIGAIRYEGRVSWAEGTQLGYVPQKLDLERELPITARELLAAKASVLHIDRSEIGPALARVGLSPSSATQPIGSLSGGQFQRLLVAFALLGRPNVLLFDEPTANVDEVGQESLGETVHAIQREQGLTLLLISHDLSVVYRYATNVLCLGHGAPCFGPPLTTLTNERLAALYGAPLSYHVHDHP